MKFCRNIWANYRISTVASAWAIALLIALPPLISWIPADRGCKCDLSTDTSYVLLSAFGTFFIPLVIVGLTYWKIYQIAARRMKITKSKLEEQSKVMNEITIVNPNTIEPEIHRKKTLGPLAPKKFSGARKFSECSSTRTYKPPLCRSSSALSCSDLEKESKQSSGKNFTTIDLNPRHPLNAANCTENTELLDRLYKDRIQRIRKKERQSTLLVTMIILSFVICWGPFFVVYMLRGFSIIIEGIIFDVFFFFGYCNSAVNPVLYGLFNADFKASFKKVLMNRKWGFQTLLYVYFLNVEVQLVIDLRINLARKKFNSSFGTFP